jgi:hypothetical protein
MTHLHNGVIDALLVVDSTSKTEAIELGVDEDGK